MSSVSRQLGLFDSGGAIDPEEEARARLCMRAMIDRLRVALAPPWQDQMGVILDDGAFQRAMRMVPAAEAQAMWVEFDAQMERLFAMPPCTDEGWRISPVR